MKQLIASGIRKEYPGFQLGPVSYNFSIGRAYGLLGPNGAGKTTLLNCLTGHSDHQGKVMWGDEEADRASWRLRAESDYVPESAYLYDDLTVKQTLAFGRRVFRRWDENRADTWSRKFGLDMSKHVRDLSKGMRVKLGVLFGLCHRASVILLDEPTSGLDPESRQELHGWLRCLPRECNTCLFLSSHLFEDIESVADEVLILRDGRIRVHVSMEQLGSAEQYRVSVHDLCWDSREVEGAVISGCASQERVSVIVWDRSRLPAGLTQILENGEPQPATLKDIYFSLCS